MPTTDMQNAPGRFNVMDYAGALDDGAKLIQRPDVEKLPRNQCSKIERHVHISGSGNRRSFFVSQYTQRFVERCRAANVHL